MGEREEPPCWEGGGVEECRVCGDGELYSRPGPGRKEAR